ncbi:MAG: hypothetical protein CMJ86_09560 [Planctomycetes bacterium]|jgi:hypothetical protein|nr:hypothetical protein [Planctomycetota bacterium]MDP6368945.1 hypothetical protein [Planctomycetota bacterium]
MSTQIPNDEQITNRDDLDGLTDDETILRTPEERAQLALKVALVSAALILFMIFATWLLRPEGQIMVERWPNGYTKTETTYRSQGGERQAHGAYRAWHENGQLKAEGQHAAGLKEGSWVYYEPNGDPDKNLSGTYRGDQRIEL